MKQKFMLPTTQRAYTLRLRGADPEGAPWRENLWKTHEAVNKGAKAFGDWLLTMRGGLCHTLADTRDKRIILALSWLSVESEKGAPVNYFVPHDLDTKSGKRRWKILDELKKILKARGVSEEEIAEWAEDCNASLSADIRDDAVWVNRSKTFDVLCNGQDVSKARKDAQTLIWFLLSDDFLVLPRKAKKIKKEENIAGDEDGPSEEELEDEKQDAAIKSGKGAGQRTRHPFSHIFGFKEDSQGFGKGKQKLELKDHWKQYLKPLINESGIPLLETKQKKNEGASPTEFHREMLSKAASRFAQIHTKQKQQEVEREQRMAADEELKRFENDTVYSNALAKLKEYCERYEEGAGSLRRFLFQPRQISKWENVVEAWAKITETDIEMQEERRKEETKRLQEELREVKFGDINLFLRLAEEEYKPVWWCNNRADASILKTFVKGMKARADAEFLKVAAYRHPDSYFNPVFCQFGVSRPAIEFYRLNPSAKDDIRIVRMLTWDGKKAEKQQYLAVSKRFDAEIGSICESIHECSTKPLVSRRDRLNLSAIGGDKENVRVAHVFDRKDVRKRKKDAESINTDIEKSKEKDPEWNGTLQADRRDLEKIGKFQKDKSKAGNLISKLNWSLIVSMELQAQGPWIEYITNATNKSPFERIYKSGAKKDQSYISFTGWPWESENKNREGMAKLVLSRLPGLRLLSVDLGHRYAAACAVWEAISSEEMHAACEKAGLESPKDGDLYLHIKSQDGKKTTIYRRIGSDTVEGIDKNTGESRRDVPWARLDRQFLIKLQGEEKDVRMATADEIWQVHCLEKELGRSRPLIDRLAKAGWGSDTKFPKQQMLLEELTKKGWMPINAPSNNGDEEEIYLHRQSLSVDDLMSSAVDTVRLALRRHGDRARIAFAMEADHKIMPGEKKYYWEPGKDDFSDTKEERHKNRIEFLTDALSAWHALASSNVWPDKKAEDLWNGQFRKEDVPLKEDDKQKTLQEVKKGKDALREKLKPVAKKLVDNASLRTKLRCMWGARWHEDDGKPRYEKEVNTKGKETGKIIDNRTGTGWHARLRLLNNWILPRGILKVYKNETGKWVKKIQEDRLKASMNVGGLSLTRIAIIKSLYQVQKAYSMRPEPDDLRKNVPAKGDDAMRNFGQSILDTLERMRENRVKQLASRIAEAALGIGREHLLTTKKDPQRQCWCGRVHDSKKDPQRPRERINKPGFAPCHAIVVESLTHYRPEETRTRRENRQLMDWSAAKVKKYLSEACELNGLHLREAPAGYTSRQDSRTGAAGARCDVVAVKDFLNLPWHRKAVERAREKNDAISCYLVDLYERWKDKDVEAQKSNIVYVPSRSGEFFVSAKPCWCCERSERKDTPRIQADLNAAANIGLRALLDPDWAGRWWYVPCDSKEFKPVADKVKGCTVFQDVAALKSIAKKEDKEDSESTGKKKGLKKNKSREVVNLWRDPSGAKISDGWKTTPEYRKQVQSRVVQNLRKQARLDKEDIPF